MDNLEKTVRGFGGGAKEVYRVKFYKVVKINALTNYTKL
jgi:hypothetical protein